MSLLLTLEQGPRPQSVRQMRLDEGAIVIGRSAEADWPIDDPDMYVSRAHCTVAAGPDGYTVTDTSSGGLFLDASPAPLGRGRSAPLRHGARLRLGDYVVRVDLVGAEEAAAAAPPPAAGRRDEEDDDFFAPRPAPPPPPRPPGLPEPFDAPPASRGAAEETRRPHPPLLDDVFTLDPAPSQAPTPTSAPDEIGPISWDDAPATPPPRPTPAPRPAERPAPAAEAGPPAAPSEAREAFLRGLGLDPAAHPATDPAAEMEAFGRAHRLMVEGLMSLLRKRAEEKAGVRVAQTIVGSSAVNPLKFMPRPEDALALMIARRSPGFLDQEAAIAEAVRDLAQHHVATWRGVQGALSRMLDRFDPASLEKELASRSRVETLLAGGRKAKLWTLYEERYGEIARSAESRFLGAVGGDFRDAYEGEG
jgi:type VI secretion system protein ImpI